jgi:GNAT superfamily N-acetyltransferase
MPRTRAQSERHRGAVEAVRRICSENEEEAGWLTTYDCFEELQYVTTTDGFIAYSVLGSRSIRLAEKKFDTMCRRNLTMLPLVGPVVEVHFAFVAPAKRQMGMLRHMYESVVARHRPKYCVATYAGGDMAVYVWMKLGFHVFRRHDNGQMDLIRPCF